VLELVDNEPIFASASKLFPSVAPEYPDDALVLLMSAVVVDWFAAGSANVAEAIPAVSDPEIEVEAAVSPFQ
jgi:hypothetical protein